MEKNINQVYATFYALLYTKKVDLEKSQIGLLYWTDPEAQLKHMKLDELQMLLECFHEKLPFVFSYLEEISDFRLIEEIFQYKFSQSNIPKEIANEENTLKLSVKERIQFLNWYLKQHHKFFKNSQNVGLYEYTYRYILERNKMLGITDSMNRGKKKTEPVSFREDFYQKQQDSFTLMNYLGNPSENGRLNSDQILKKWHISKRYRDLLLQPQVKKEMVYIKSPVPSLNKLNDPKVRKEKLFRLHELWDGKKIKKFLNDEELIELKDLFGFCYGTDFGISLLRSVICQNNVLLEQKKVEVLRTCLSNVEEEKYFEMSRLVLDLKIMIPYYYEIIKKAQEEIQDILEEAVFEDSKSDYETYCLMIQEEYLKMKEAYTNLFVNGNLTRKVEL
jgi:hypothetical protein